MSLLTPELRALVGRETSYTAPEELGRAAMRYFALAIGDHNPLYTDQEFARAHGYPDVIAPPTLICETNQYAGLLPDPDGYAGHSWHLDVPAPGWSAAATPTSSTPRCCPRTWLRRGGGSPR